MAGVKGVEMVLGTQGGDVEVRLTGGPAGTTHHTGLCVVLFIEIAADREGRLEVIPDAQVCSHLVCARRTAPAHRVSDPAAAGDERCAGVDGSFRAVRAWIR